MWSIIKKAVNSDLSTPLNTLIDSLKTETNKIQTIKTTIGQNADPASASGSVHGKLKYIMENYPAIYKDPYETPGPQMLSAGTLELGYFGHVVAGVLMNGSALATAVGLSAGTLQHSDAGWEKFAVDGKILFVATKTIRHSVSWNNIDAAGAVTGTATVNINGKTYKVRLLTGGSTNPSSGGDGGEWNILMYALHQDQAPPWASYSDTDLLTISSAGNGSRSWCQDSSSSTNRVFRGYAGVTDWAAVVGTNTNSDKGWRPVLELL